MLITNDDWEWTDFKEKVMDNDWLPGFKIEELEQHLANARMVKKDYEVLRDLFDRNPKAVWARLEKAEAEVARLQMLLEGLEDDMRRVMAQAGESNAEYSERIRAAGGIGDGGGE